MAPRKEKAEKAGADAGLSLRFPYLQRHLSDLQPGTTMVMDYLSKQGRFLCYYLNQLVTHCREAEVSHPPTRRSRLLSIPTPTHMCLSPTVVHTLQVLPSSRQC